MISRPSATSPGPRPFHTRAHGWLKSALRPGAVAVDGTCGNGHDTLFLCQALAGDGFVLGIDIQEPALRRTRERLSDHGCEAKLLRGDHGRLDEYLDAAGFPQIDAAIFNLGYFPGGDHAITTLPASTVEALRACLARGAGGFRLAVTAYRGHPGGADEERAVRAFMVEATAAGHPTVREETPGDGPVFYGLARHHPESI